MSSTKNLGYKQGEQLKIDGKAVTLTVSLGSLGWIAESEQGKRIILVPVGEEEK